LKDALCAFTASSHNSAVVGEPSFSTNLSRIWDGAAGDGLNFFKQTKVCLNAILFRVYSCFVVVIVSLLIFKFAKKQIQWEIHWVFMFCHLILEVQS
jgi:hypothetical protein